MAKDNEVSSGEPELDINRLVAEAGMTGEPDAVTVPIGTKRLEYLSTCERTIDALRIALAQMSDGPYDWGAVEGGPDQAEFVQQNLALGSGPMHLVWLPEHEKTIVGPNRDKPEHAVTLCITGNGPNSAINARMLIEILTRIAGFPMQ